MEIRSQKNIGIPQRHVIIFFSNEANEANPTNKLYEEMRLKFYTLERSFMKML